MSISDYGIPGGIVKARWDAEDGADMRWQRLNSRNDAARRDFAVDGDRVLASEVERDALAEVALGAARVMAVGPELLQH